MAPSASPGVRNEIEASRAAVASQGGANLWTADWEAIADMEILPGYPMREDCWILDPNWTSGQRRSLSRRTLDFAKALPPGWDRSESRSENVIRRSKRLAAILYSQPARLNLQYRNPPKPSTWARIVQRLIGAVREAVPACQSTYSQSSCPDKAELFRGLTPEQVKEIFKAGTDTLSSAIPRLNGFFKEGIFDDWPAHDVYVRDPKRNAVWLPFDDQFVSDAGRAAIWVVEELGPPILEFYRGIRELRAMPETKSHPRKAKERRVEFAKEFGARMERDGIELRYGLRVFGSVSGTDRGSILRSWADLAPRMADSLVQTLQEAHAWVISLATGPREGELMSLPRECLRATTAGRLMRGYTFKLSDSVEERDWPLPLAAVRAIEQQRQLADLIDPPGETLFVLFRVRPERKAEGDKAREKLRFRAYSFTDNVFLEGDETLTSRCVGNVHGHRFRKTVARLAALSLVGASEILYDVLGHRDPEMTLAYILSDPELQEEMRIIAKEAAMAIAHGAVDAADQNGGPAAEPVRQLVARFAARSAQQEMDESELIAVAQILSQNGRAMLVKRNVLCTKTVNQAGPCNKRLGNPDIGNCQISCIHRLELAAARQDTRIAVDRALAEFELADGMMRQWWRGQIIALLSKFEDMASEYMSMPQVRAVFVGICSERLPHWAVVNDNDAGEAAGAEVA